VRPAMINRSGLIGTDITALHVRSFGRSTYLDSQDQTASIIILG
jgi:hypothetical protein